MCFLHTASWAGSKRCSDHTGNTQPREPRGPCAGCPRGLVGSQVSHWVGQLAYSSPAGSCCPILQMGIRQSEAEGPVPGDSWGVLGQDTDLGALEGLALSLTLLSFCVCWTNCANVSL